MDATSHEVNSWIEQAFGEEAHDLSIWAEEDELVQVLIRLSDKVVISDLTWEDGVIVEEDSLVIRLSNWQPNSIQTRRMPDGFVRFRHRSNEIMLAPRVRCPDWAAGLLEGWLIEMRGDTLLPKSRQQRLSSVKRLRDTVEKMLDQANLSVIRDEINFIEHRLNNADNRLSGRNPNYSSSEE